jgi:hypothetical protein
MEEGGGGPSGTVWVQTDAAQAQDGIGARPMRFSRST